MSESKGSGLGIVGYDGYEFVVADQERSRKFYNEMMDVPEVARLDEKIAAGRGEDAVIFQAGKAQCVCVTPRERGSAADRWLKRHPDGVRTVGFRVRDLDHTRRVLGERNATFPADSSRRKSDAVQRLRRLGDDMAPRVHRRLGRNERNQGLF